MDRLVTRDMAAKEKAICIGNPALGRAGLVGAANTGAASDASSGRNNFIGNFIWAPC